MDLLYLLQALSVIVITSVLFYKYNMKNKNFWKDRGIPFIPQKFLLGNFDLGFSSKRQHEYDTENYKKYGGIFGGFEGSKPILYVADPDLIKDLTIKDFTAFSSRRIFQYQDEIIKKMVAAATGDDWRRMRSLMSPAFSSGKMRAMSKLIDECAKTAAINLRTACSKESVDMKKIFGAFTMDTIASTVFGTKIDSHNDPNNPFVKYASKVFAKEFNFRMLLVFIFPFLGKILNVRFVQPEIQEFFTAATKRIMDDRNRKKDTKRVDFVQLIMDANKLEEASKGISEEEIVANCILFFIAGYDSTASTLCSILYNLARNEKCQERLAEEISAVLKDTKGLVDYDTIKSMPYLDAVVNESLRLFPPATRTEREAVEKYTFKDPSFQIPKGMVTGILIYPIHKDPKYFTDPEKFNPERFMPNNEHLMNPNAYMPFGSGPRTCLAMRFALFEIKMNLARIIPDFRFTLSPKTKVPPEFFTAFEVLTPKNMFLKVEPRR